MGEKTDQISNDVIRKLTNQDNPAPKSTITGSQVYNWLVDQAKALPTLTVVFLLVGAGVWHLWGQPAVKEVVTDTLGKFVNKLDSTADKAEENRKDIQQIKFDVKQVLLILQKTNTKKVVDEVKEETEIFRPENEDSKK